MIDDYRESAAHGRKVDVSQVTEGDMLDLVDNSTAVYAPQDFAATYQVAGIPIEGKNKRRKYFSRIPHPGEMLLTYAKGDFEFGWVSMICGNPAIQFDINPPQLPPDTRIPEQFDSPSGPPIANNPPANPGPYQQQPAAPAEGGNFSLSVGLNLGVGGGSYPQQGYNPNFYDGGAASYPRGGFFSEGNAPVIVNKTTNVTNVTNTTNSNNVNSGNTDNSRTDNSKHDSHDNNSHDNGNTVVTNPPPPPNNGHGGHPGNPGGNPGGNPTGNPTQGGTGSGTVTPSPGVDPGTGSGQRGGIQLARNTQGLFSSTPLASAQTNGNVRQPVTASNNPVAATPNAGTRNPNRLFAATPNTNGTLRNDQVAAANPNRPNGLFAKNLNPATAAATTPQGTGNRPGSSTRSNPNVATGGQANRLYANNPNARNAPQALRPATISNAGRGFTRPTNGFSTGGGRGFSGSNPVRQQNFQQPRMTVPQGNGGGRGRRS